MNFDNLCFEAILKCRCLFKKFKNGFVQDFDVFLLSVVCLVCCRSFKLSSLSYNNCFGVKLMKHIKFYKLTQFF